MAMKEYSAFHKARALLEPHYCLVLYLGPVCSDAVGVFYSPSRLGKCVSVCVYVCMCVWRKFVREMLILHMKEGLSLDHHPHRFTAEVFTGIWFPSTYNSLKHSGNLKSNSFIEKILFLEHAGAVNHLAVSALNRCEYRPGERPFLVHIPGAYYKFPDFFRIGTFIDSTHMKL